MDSPLIPALIHVTGNKAAPGLWMSFAAVCGLATILLIFRKNTGGEPLHSSTGEKVPL